MGQRTKLVCGSLVGALAIHAALIACGSSGMGGGSGSDAGGGRGGGGIFDALVDALTGRDARADTDGGGVGTGSGGACSCGGPTKIASEDPAQWVSGAVFDNGSAPSVLATGPLMVRHVMMGAPAQPGLTSLVFVAKDGKCAPTTWAVGDFNRVEGAMDPDRFAIQIGQGNADLSFPVPAGAALCLGPSAATSTDPNTGSGAPVVWSGFRPYP